MIPMDNTPMSLVSVTYADRKIRELVLSDSLLPPARTVIPSPVMGISLKFLVFSVILVFIVSVSITNYKLFCLLIITYFVDFYKGRCIMNTYLIKSGGGTRPFDARQPSGLRFVASPKGANSYRAML